MKEELDLTFVKMAQEHYQKVKSELNDQLVDEFYEKSLSSKKIEVHGELYVGKNVIMKGIGQVVGIASGILLIIMLGKAATTADLMDRYYNILSQQAQQELTQKEFAYYQDNKPNVIEAYHDYQEKEEELKQTGNYNSLGDNIDNDSQATYSKGDFLVPTNIQEDALRMAVSEQIQEYKGKR